MLKTKRDATPAEIADAVAEHVRWLECHGYDDCTEKAVLTKIAQAEMEGFKNETCSCGCTFLAFHHLTTCREKGCPFSDGVSLLDRMEQRAED